MVSGVLHNVHLGVIVARPLEFLNGRSTALGVHPVMVAICNHTSTICMSESCISLTNKGDGDLESVNPVDQR